MQAGSCAGPGGTAGGWGKTGTQATGLGGGSPQGLADGGALRERRGMTRTDALERLKEGNRRFVHHLRSAEVMMSQLRRGELAKGQNPFAIVLGCSDSRVPAEIVFDQGLGDLFVIRVAGNIVAPSQIGSVEF